MRAHSEGNERPAKEREGGRMHSEKMWPNVPV